MESGGEERRGGGPAPRNTAVYSLLVGLAFIALIGVAAINLLSNSGDAGVLTPDDAGWPLPQFAVPSARSSLTGDANIAQDDCSVSAVPCPESERRSPACRVDLPGAIRVCDLFGRPLVLSFWFTRGGDCEAQEDVFEAAYRRFRGRVNFLAVDVRDSRDQVRHLIASHRWTHPVGLDSDGALSNLYRIGGCPTFLYVYPGGILRTVTIGELDESELDGDVRALVAASARRERSEG
jgi:hypothetical protein